MLVLDFAEIHEQINNEIAYHEDHLEESQPLLNQMERIANSTDILQGEGGEGVRELYANMSIPALQAEMDFSEFFIQVLRKIKESLHDLDTEDALWKEEFITQDLREGISRINAETRELELGVQNVATMIREIVDIGRLNAESMYETSDEGRKRIKQMEAKMDNFKQEIDNLASTIGESLQYMENWQGRV